MRITRPGSLSVTRRQAIGAALLMLLLATTGCGEAGKANGGAIGAPLKPPPSGIVTFFAPPGGPTFVVAFSDPNTGKISRTALSDVGGVTPARQRFSADMTMLATTDRDAIQIVRLGVDGYTETTTTTWKPNVPDDAGVALSDVIVNPVTGRIWFKQTVARVTADGLVYKSMQTMSIDPNIADDVPRREPIDYAPVAFDATGAPATTRKVLFGTSRSNTVDLVASDTQVVTATVVAQAGVAYHCPSPITADTLLCYGDIVSAAAMYGVPFGSVAEMRFDRVTERVTMRQIVPRLDVRLTGMVMSPDGKQVRMQTEDGWLSSALPVNGSPQPVQMEDTVGKPIAWIP